MITVTYPLSDFADGTVEVSVLQAAVDAEVTLPAVLYVSARADVDGQGLAEIAFDADEALSRPQAMALDAVVAAHSGAASALVTHKAALKAQIDARTAILHAIRQIAALSAGQIDDGGDAAKAAVDAAATAEQADAAVAADGRPRLTRSGIDG